MFRSSSARSNWRFLSSSCTCEDEGGDPADCDGCCWETGIEEVSGLLAAWIAEHPVDDSYQVTGTGVGWQHRTVTGLWNPRTEKLWETIAVKSDWEQEYTLFDDRLEIVQSHHDAPRGERWVVWPGRGRAEAARSRAHAASATGPTPRPAERVG